MKSSTNQNPQKSSNRRSKETPSKRSDFKNSNTSEQEKNPSKIVAKCLNSAFSAASEDDPIDSLLALAISDGNQEKDLLEIGGKNSNPFLSDSSDQIDLSDSSPVMEIGDGIRDLGEVLDGNENSGGSDRVKTENVDVQIAVDLLLGARDQVMNSPDVDMRSKKIVEDLIKRVIEPLDLLPQETDGFYGRLREKVYIGLMCFFACVVSVSVIILRDAGTVMDFPDTFRPT